MIKKFSKIKIGYYLNDEDSKEKVFVDLDNYLNYLIKMNIFNSKNLKEFILEFWCYSFSDI